MPSGTLERYGDPKATRPEGNILLALNVLEHAAKAIAEDVGALETRLAGLLRPVPPAAVSTTDSARGLIEKGSVSDVAARLEGIRHVLDNAQSHVHELNQRIDI